MKRHPGLVPLSREHHDGLLLATRLQQGPKALLRLWSHDPAWQSEFVTRFFSDHLDAHFRTEEEHLFPAARALPECRKVVDALLTEHNELRALSASLAAVRGEELPALLARFGRLLELHIRSEERVLFPAMERHLSAADWERIQSAVGHRHGA